MVGVAMTFAVTLFPLIVILRVGLLGSAVMFMVAETFINMSMTLDSSKLYATGSWAIVAMTVALAAAGLWLARSGDVLTQRVERIR